MKLFSDRQITFGGITHHEGEPFDCDDRVAEELLQRGNVRRAAPPQVLYETKPARFETPMILPETQEVQPALGGPFRGNGTPRNSESGIRTLNSSAPADHLPLRDTQPPSVAAPSGPLLPQPDLSQQRAFDRGGRGKHKRSGYR